MNKQVICVNDLSGRGRCSLTAAIPVLAALGLHPCPLPTSVLSAQTGFDGYRMEDLTGRMDDFLDHWEDLAFSPAGICTGFFSSAQQPDKLHRLLDRCAGPDCPVLVDPIMGDNGHLYPTSSPELCEALKRLVARADIVTPNLTEACLLTDTDHAALLQELAETDDLEPVLRLAVQLRKLGPKQVIITGVHLEDLVYNVVTDGKEHIFTRSPAMGGPYSGTGDLFSAVIFGLMLRGIPFFQAATSAAVFLEYPIRDAWEAGTPGREGVPFERHLGMLTDVAKSMDAQ